MTTDIPRVEQAKRILRIMHYSGSNKQEFIKDTERYEYFLEFVYHELKPYFSILENNNIEIELDKTSATRNMIREKFHSKKFVEDYLRRFIGIINLSIKHESNTDIIDRLNSHLIACLSAFFRGTEYTVLEVKTGETFIIFRSK